MVEKFREGILIQRVTEGLILRDVIESLLKQVGCKIGVIKPSINPRLYQITDVSPIVIEDYYGVPNKIYTPVGYLEINLDYTSWNRLSKSKKEYFFSVLKNIDIHEYKEKIESDYGYLGGWRKRGSNEPVFRDINSYVDYNDAYDIYSKALQSLRSTYELEKVSL